MSFRWLWPVGAALLLPVMSVAATLSGEVRSDGQPVRGAMVTLFSGDQLYSETVLTNQDGAYKLATEQKGKLTLRVRAARHADDTATVTVPAGTATVKQPFTLRVLKTPQEISDDLPSTAHLARVKIPDPAWRKVFQMDCTECHQLNAALTNKVRSLDEWKALMHVMTLRAEYTSDVRTNDYAAFMQKAFDGKPIADHENRTVDAAALNERVTEWKLPGALGAHDTNIYPPTGAFYSVDMFVDDIFVTDPHTNTTQRLPIPPLGVKIGGSFAGEGANMPTYVGNVRHGLHSLELGSDNKFYMTGSIGGNVVVYDPARKTFDNHMIGSGALVPHTPRFDSKGILWFSLYASNQVGRFDPQTGRVTVIQLPNNWAHKEILERPAAVYGLDISPVDGSVWYTKLYANQIGRIDPVTYQVQEWVPPVYGPRRARFDAKGGLWIPGYGDGQIARLDTKTMKYDLIRVPTFAPDEVEAPYAVAIEPKTQDLWVSANLSERMFRYQPASKQWTSYPLPTRGTITRDIVFNPDGRVCGVSNPWGIPAPGIVEGNMDAIICLDPGSAK